MHHAQPGRLRVKVPTWRPKVKKEILSMELSLDKQETLLFHKSACSAYAPRTARMPAFKSTYMQAGGQQVDSAFGAHRLTNKKHCFRTKALVQCMNDAQPEFLCENAHTLYISAKGQKVDSVFGILCCANKSQRFPTKALVQRMDHAQPEFSSFTKLSWWLKPKSRFCVSNFALRIQSAMLF